MISRLIARSTRRRARRCRRDWERTATSSFFFLKTTRDAVRLDSNFYAFAPAVHDGSSPSHPSVSCDRQSRAGALGARGSTSLPCSDPKSSYRYASSSAEYSILRGRPDRRRIHQAPPAHLRPPPPPRRTHPPRRRDAGRCRSRRGVGLRRRREEVRPERRSR